MVLLFSPHTIACVCQCRDHAQMVEGKFKLWSSELKGLNMRRKLLIWENFCIQICASMDRRALIRILKRQAAADIGLHVNAHKTEYMCFNQTGDISTLNSSCLKLVDKFTYLGSSITLTETDINTRLAKAWTAINRLSVIWKSDLTDKIKCSFFEAAVMSILLYGCATWTLTKRMEKTLNNNYTRMLRAILNKSWR